MKQWTYGMRHRGYSIGCQPMGSLVERQDSKEYVNRNTGEVTSIHGLAMAWYRNGDEVDIYRDGKFIMGWDL